MTQIDQQPISILLSTFLTGLAALVSLPACDGDEPPNPPALQWYTTCGDPACGGYNPDPNLPLCTDQTDGATCAQSGEQCVIPDNDCNEHLLCTDTDPAVNCPISLQRHKRDIRYLGASERSDILDHLLATRLATYRYRSEPDAAPRRLGFLIDDQGQSPAVLPSGERVDLYGYTSMAVAAIQVQAEQIQRMDQEIKRLQAELDALRKPARPGDTRGSVLSRPSIGPGRPAQQVRHGYGRP